MLIKGVPYLIDVKDQKDNWPTPSHQIERVIIFREGWQAVRYKGKYYQLHGGLGIISLSTKIIL